MSHVRDAPRSMAFALETGNVSKTIQQNLTFWDHSPLTLWRFLHFYCSFQRQKEEMCSNNSESYDWNVSDRVAVQDVYPSTCLSIYPYSFFNLSFFLSFSPPSSPFTPSPSLSVSLSLHFRSCFIPPSSSLSVFCGSQSSVQGPINKPSDAYWEPMIAALPRGLILPFLAPSSFLFPSLLSVFVSLCHCYVPFYSFTMWTLVLHADRRSNK